MELPTRHSCKSLQQPSSNSPAAPWHCSYSSLSLALSANTLCPPLPLPRRSPRRSHPKYPPLSASDRHVTCSRRRPKATADANRPQASRNHQQTRPFTVPSTA
ncbi:hypothetical protein H113_04893, partial [Trichophyton rubrum MR1459]